MIACRSAAIVADEPREEVLFHTAFHGQDLTSSSVTSLTDLHSGANPFDFSVYMDQASSLQHIF